LEIRIKWEGGGYSHNSRIELTKIKLPISELNSDQFRQFITMLYTIYYIGSLRINNNLLNQDDKGRRHGYSHITNACYFFQNIHIHEDDFATEFPNDTHCPVCESPIPPCVENNFLGFYPYIPYINEKTYICEYEISNIKFYIRSTDRSRRKTGLIFDSNLIKDINQSINLAIIRWQNIMSKPFIHLRDKLYFREFIKDKDDNIINGLDIRNNIMDIFILSIPISKDINIIENKLFIHESKSMGINTKYLLNTINDRHIRLSFWIKIN
jgi:hypothetical protein